jgi:hypothetical protein
LKLDSRSCDSRFHTLSISQPLYYMRSGNPDDPKQSFSCTRTRTVSRSNSALDYLEAHFIAVITKDPDQDDRRAANIEILTNIASRRYIVSYPRTRQYSCRDHERQKIGRQLVRNADQRKRCQIWHMDAARMVALPRLPFRVTSLFVYQLQ